MGAAEPQSELLRHSTHCPDDSRHRGLDAGQLLFCEHWTHWLVLGSQMEAPAPQSVELWQPTHSPVPDAVSQIGVFLGQAVDELQAGWHWWSPGQHEGDAAGEL